jgi:GNAT superfamily N-acetyltransferase
VTPAATHPAIPALVDALIGDVFYQTILIGHADDGAKRAALARYMAYSIEEAERTGRVVLTADRTVGAALWLLPRAADVDAREHAAKHALLRDVLGPRGYGHYTRITGYMHAHSEASIPGDAWYLSILGVRSSAQGQGIGQRLIAPTLAEADAAGATSWLETFTTGGARFYERAGFRLVAWHDEPTTGRPYAILRREPAGARPTP